MIFTDFILLQANVRSGKWRIFTVSSEISDLRNFWLHTMYAWTG